MFVHKFNTIIVSHTRSGLLPTRCCHSHHRCWSGGSFFRFLWRWENRNCSEGDPTTQCTEGLEETREKERDNERTWRDKQEKWKTSSGSKFKTDGHLLGPDQNGCPVVVLRSGGNACSSCAMVSWYRSWKRRRAHSIHSSNVFGLFSPTAETSTCKVKSCRRPEIVMIVLILGHILTGSLPSSFNVLSTKAGSLHNKQQYSIDSRE